MKLRFGIYAGLVLAFFCVYPQLKLVYNRGDAFNGHYAYNDIDEVAYASYVKALMDGRPRKNDPYSGRDSSPAEPQPESLFSIQFAAPYTIAIPASILGVPVTWAMTLSGAFAGLLAVLAAFWLIFRMTANSWYAMAASLTVFAGGALFAGEGALSEIAFDGFSYPYFPGFRRYIPALAMPAIFALFALVWKLIGRDAAAAVDKDADAGQSKSVSVLTIVMAVAAFAYCVFSYFFIWTTAAAWLGCVAMLWLALRPKGWLDDIKKLAWLGAGCVAALLPYAYLLSHRSETMDDVQLLIYSRALDLARVPEYISVVCLIVLAVAVAAKMIDLRGRSTIFAASLALVPLVVFNQQLITGRSLQPIHYQVFIGNYVAGLALVVTVGVIWGRAIIRGGLGVRIASAVLFIAATAWGIAECHYTVRVLDDANIERDIALPVGQRLTKLGEEDADPFRSTVLAYDMIEADDLPTIAPQNVLWSRHQHVFAGLSWEESKVRFYQYLYYSNVDGPMLDHMLKNDFVSQIALFGWGRHSTRLSADAKPLTYGEIADEVAKYEDYRANFSVVNAASPLLRYAVVNDDTTNDLSKLDEWYDRDEGEQVGKYTIFKLRLKGR